MLRIECGGQETIDKPSRELFHLILRIKALGQVFLAHFMVEETGT